MVEIDAGGWLLRECEAKEGVLGRCRREDVRTDISGSLVDLSIAQSVRMTWRMNDMSERRL